MIKAILYDKDGTLIDLNGRWLHSIIHLIDRYCHGNQHLALSITGSIGIDPLKRRVIPFTPIAQGPFHEVATIIHKTLGNNTLRQEDILQELILVANLNETAPIPLKGSVETLRAMHLAGMIQGIISNDSIARIEKTTHEIGIAEYIAYVRGSDSCCGPKPAPEMVQQFCNEFCLSAQQVLVVGDSPADMETALGAGCLHMVAIHDNPVDPVLSAYTPHIITDLSYLPKLILEKLH